jgi:hypothetical protein
MPPSLRVALCMAVLAPATAMADLRVSYLESAPDWFTIRNGSGCELGPFELAIDLGRSPAGLIFDVSGSGAGFAGYAPLAVVDGGEQVVSIGRITDGDSRLVVELDFLAGDGTVRVVVDVDDTNPASEFGPTIISGAEFAGALAEVRSGDGPPVSAVFGADGVAVLELEACVA